METTGCLSRLEVEPRFQRLLHWGPEFLGLPLGYLEARLRR